jgi:hypothetical protein
MGEAGASRTRTVAAGGARRSRRYGACRIIQPVTVTTALCSILLRLGGIFGVQVTF